MEGGEEAVARQSRVEEQRGRLHAHRAAQRAPEEREPARRALLRGRKRGHHQGQVRHLEETGPEAHQGHGGAEERDRRRLADRADREQPGRLEREPDAQRPPRADAVGQQPAQRRRERGGERGEHEDHAAHAGREAARGHQEERHQQPDRELRVLRQERERARAQHGQAQQVGHREPARRGRGARDAAEAREGEQRQDQEQRRAEHEGGGPAEAVHEQAAQHRAHPEADADAQAHRAEPAAVPRGRERQRHERGRGPVDHAAAHALRHAQQQHRTVGGGERVAHEAGRAEPEPGREDRPGAETIREQARRERGERVGEDVADDDPADLPPARRRTRRPSRGARC